MTKSWHSGAGDDKLTNGVSDSVGVIFARISKRMENYSFSDSALKSRAENVKTVVQQRIQKQFQNDLRNRRNQINVKSFEKTASRR